MRRRVGENERIISSVPYLYHGTVVSGLNLTTSHPESQVRRLQFLTIHHGV